MGLFDFLAHKPINDYVGRNPDGLTFDEFVAKYPDIKHIAYLCWYLGIYPEQLRKEISILMSKETFE